MEHPCYEIVPGPEGGPLFLVTFGQLHAMHSDLWQAELKLEQQAADTGTALPEVWLQTRLGYRSRPK